MERVALVAGIWFLFWMIVGSVVGGLTGGPHGGVANGIYFGAFNGAWWAVLTSFTWPWLMHEVHPALDGPVRGRPTRPIQIPSCPALCRASTSCLR